MLCLLESCHGEEAQVALDVGKLVRVRVLGLMGAGRGMDTWGPGAFSTHCTAGPRLLPGRSPGGSRRLARAGGLSRSSK